MLTIDAHQVAGPTGLAASRRARVTGFAMYLCAWLGNAPTISHKAWRPKEPSP